MDLEIVPFLLYAGENFPMGPFSVVAGVADLQGAVLVDRDRGKLVTQDLYDPEITVQDLHMIVRDLGVDVVPLGAIVPEILDRLIPVKDRLFLLAGDLCGELERGATCDVTSHWNAFGRYAVHVVGVLGNHDLLKVNQLQSNVHLLDGEIWGHKGLRIGGVSGIVSKKRNRDPEEFRRDLQEVLNRRPSLLLLHPPPDLGKNFSGEPVVTDALRSYPADLHVLCGHRPWPERSVQMGDRIVVWNAEGSVLIFVKSELELSGVGVDGSPLNAYPFG